MTKCTDDAGGMDAAWLPGPTSSAESCHNYNVDTGELTDIDASQIEVRGLPQLPEGMVTEGVEIIVRVRSAV